MKVGDKFLYFSISFLNDSCLGFIILYKNFNYKLIIKTVPKLTINLYKEEFNKTYYNKIHKKSTVVNYEWNGYYSYSFGKSTKEFICAKRHFVPLKILHTLWQNEKYLIKPVYIGA